MVGQHIDRLEEDGRSIRTIDTYRYAAKLLEKAIAGVRVGESTPARIDAAIRSMRRAHGDVMAVQSKTLLKGALHLAVMANVIGSNPVRDVSSIRSKQTGQRNAPALTADELRGLFGKLRASDYCQRNDLVHPITIFMAICGSTSGTANPVRPIGRSAIAAWRLTCTAPSRRWARPRTRPSE